jgi:hypothetical protein
MISDFANGRLLIGVATTLHRREKLLEGVLQSVKVVVGLALAEALSS